MPFNENFVIGFQTRGYQRVRREVGGIGETARRSATATNFLKTALAGIGGAFAIREFVRLSDSAVRYNNQLKLVTNGADNFKRVNMELHQVARDTRSDIGATIELYSRLQRSTANLALSQREVLGLTKTVNQTFQIFGNNAAEAEAAMVQFSQGLSAGALRGDELRSVLEQSPRLAQAIADGLNEIGDADLAEAFGQGFRLDDGTFDYDIVIGSLRELGKEGELTAQRVSDALASQADNVNKEFLETSATIEQSFVILKNRIIQLLQSEEAQRFIGAITSALLTMIDNFKDALPIIKAVATALAVNYALVGAGAAIRATQALTAAIRTQNLTLLSNPFIAIFAAVTGAITLAVSLFNKFGDSIRGVGDSGASLKDEVVAALRTIGSIARSVFGGLVSAIKTSFSIIESIFAPLSVSVIDFGEVFRNVVRDIITRTSVFYIETSASVAAFGVFFRGVFESFPEIARSVFVKSYNFILSVFINPMVTHFQRVGFQINQVFSQMGLDIDRTFIAVKNSVIGAFEEIVNNGVKFINDFIGLINNIPKVDVELIDPVEFERSGIAQAELEARLAEIERLRRGAEESEGVIEIPLAIDSDPLEGILGNIVNDANQAGQVATELAISELEDVTAIFVRTRDELTAARNEQDSDLETFGPTGRTIEGEIGVGNAGGDEEGSGGANRRRNPRTIQDYVRALNNEYDALLRHGPAREAQNRLLEITEKLQRNRAQNAIRDAEAANGDIKLTEERVEAIKAINRVTQDEIDLLTELINKNIEQELISDTKTDIIETLTEKQRDYNTALAATNQLVAEGLITDTQQNQVLNDTAANQELIELERELAGPGGNVELETQQLEFERQQNELILQAALERDIKLLEQSGISGKALQDQKLALEEETNQKIAQLTRRHEADVLKVKVQALGASLQAGESTFNSLGQVAKQWAGEQSGIYKALFVAEKAFALSNVVLNGIEAISEAQKLPIPANVPATIAAKANLAANVASVVATTISGLREGGRVVGAGTGTSDSIAAYLSNGEFVVNARSTERFLPVLEAINSNTPRFRDGGFVGSATLSGLAAPPAQSGGQFNIEINVETDGTQNGEEQGIIVGETVREQLETLFDSYVDREQRIGGRLEGTRINA